MPGKRKRRSIKKHDKDGTLPGSIGGGVGAHLIHIDWPGWGRARGGGGPGVLEALILLYMDPPLSSTRPGPAS